MVQQARRTDGGDVLDEAAHDVTALEMSQEPSPVRFADPCDYDELLELCSQLWAENGLFKVSDEKVRAMLAGHYERTGGIIGVIGAPGLIQGAVSLTMSQQWYSDEWFLRELFCFVLPEHRRSNNAKHLIKFAQKCAVDIGVPLIMGIISNTRTEAKARLYCRQFGKPAGAYFLSNSSVTPDAKSAVLSPS